MLPSVSGAGASNPLPETESGSLLVKVSEICSNLHENQEPDNGIVQLFGRQRILAKQMVELASFCHYTPEQRDLIANPAISTTDWKRDYSMGLGVRKAYSLQYNVTDKIEYLTKLEFKILAQGILDRHPDATIVIPIEMRRLRSTPH